MLVGLVVPFHLSRNTPSRNIDFETFEVMKISCGVSSLRAFFSHIAMQQAVLMGAQPSEDDADGGSASNLSPALAIFASSPGSSSKLLRSAMHKVRTVGAAVHATAEMKALVRRRPPVRYKDYDHDGALQLDTEEFYSLMPRRVRAKHSARSILSWYDACSTANGKSTCSINEFFLWTLLSPQAAIAGANSLGAALIRYDTAPEFEAPGVRRNGNLDKGELAVACRDMGFTTRDEHELIFKSLDKDMSGEVRAYFRLSSLAALEHDVHNHHV